MADKPNKELGGPRKLSTTAKVIIVIFAFIMAFSMMLPSLASVFGGRSSSSSETEESTEQTDTTEEEAAEEEKDDFDPMDGVPENDSLKQLAETNAQKAHDYEKRLKKDPENLALLLNLGETYMNWGYSAVTNSTTDEETAYSKGLIEKAEDAFNRYLKIRESDAVKVNLAQCQNYKGDTKGAIKSLVSITKESPDYPLAWVYLGMFYEQSGDNEKATEAYHKAIDTDPNDEYGVKSYANQQLISMNSTVDSPADAGEATVAAEPTSEEGSLTDKLETLD